MLDYVFVVTVSFDRDVIGADVATSPYTGPQRLAFATEQEASDYLVGLAVTDTELQPHLAYTIDSVLGDDASEVSWVESHSGAAEHLIGLIYRVPQMTTYEA